MYSLIIQGYELSRVSNRYMPGIQIKYVYIYGSIWVVTLEVEGDN